MRTEEVRSAGSSARCMAVRPRGNYCECGAAELWRLNGFVSQLIGHADDVQSLAVHHKLDFLWISALFFTGGAVSCSSQFVCLAGGVNVQFRRGAIATGFNLFGPKISFILYFV
jgi:hypothetical protein